MHGPQDDDWRWGLVDPYLSVKRADADDLGLAKVLKRVKQLLVFLIAGQRLRQRYDDRPLFDSLLLDLYEPLY